MFCKINSFRDVWHQISSMNVVLKKRKDFVVHSKLKISQFLLKVHIVKKKKDNQTDVRKAKIFWTYVEHLDSLSLLFLIKSSSMSSNHLFLRRISLLTPPGRWERSFSLYVFQNHWIRLNFISVVIFAIALCLF